MFYAKSIIAMDMGSKYIRAILGRKLGQNVSIIDYGSYEVPYDLDDGLNSIKNLLDGLSKIIGRMIPKQRNVLIGIKDPNIITRHIILPVMKEKYLKQAAEYEFNQYLPLSSNEYVIGYKISKILKDSRCADILMVAVPRRTVDFNMEIANKLGMSIKGIDIFANSILGLFNCDAYSSDSSLLADIGYRHTDIIILEGCSLYFHRCLNIGSSTIVERKMDSLQSVNYSILDELVDNLLEVLEFYSSTRPGKVVRHMYLYGDGAGIHGVLDYIKSLLNIEISALHERVIGNVRNMDEFLKDNLHRYLNCLSLLFKCKSI